MNKQSATYIIAFLSSTNALLYANPYLSPLNSALLQQLSSHFEKQEPVRVTGSIADNVLSKTENSPASNVALVTIQKELPKEMPTPLLPLENKEKPQEKLEQPQAPSCALPEISAAVTHNSSAHTDSFLISPEQHQQEKLTAYTPSALSISDKLEMAKLENNDTKPMGYRQWMSENKIKTAGGCLLSIVVVCKFLESVFFSGNKK